MKAEAAARGREIIWLRPDYQEPRFGKKGKDVRAA